MTYEAMLAADCANGRAYTLLQLDEWWLQQKLDGNRVIMNIVDGQPYPLNRGGNDFNGVMNRNILNDFRGDRWKGEWLLDGEALKNHYYIFDLTMVSGNSLVNAQYETRYSYLEKMFEAWSPQYCSLVPTFKTSAEKQAIAKEVRDIGGEGVMFKYRYGLYAPGKRSDKMLKWKFVKTCDAVVREVGRKGRASIALGVYDGSTLVDIGACTMTMQNLERMRVGDVVEIRYLYAGAGGKLVQPAFVRKRNDKAIHDCTIDQLFFVNKDALV